MTEKVGERKDFPSWVVDQVFMDQDGICANPECYNPLSAGFHRHHKDGDHSNNKKENCELFCLECHFSKKAEQTKGHNQFKYHLELQGKIIDAIFRVTALGESGKLQTTAIERILNGYEQASSMSWKTFSHEIEYPSPIFAMYRNIQKNEILEDAHRAGYEKGITEGGQIVISYIELLKKKLEDLGHE